jgi:hypothetical protein
MAYAKVFLNEIYDRVWVGKHISDTFPIMNGLKKGRYFINIAFQICIRYAFRRVEANQEGLQLNGTLQLLVFVDGVYTSGGRIYSVKRGTEGLVVAS